MMKFIKLFFVAGAILVFNTAYSQIIDTIDVDYDYRFISTGKLSEEHDTIYTVYFLIDTADLTNYKRLRLIAGKNEKIFSVKPEDITNDPRFVLDGTKYTFNTGAWTQTTSLLITGKKYDDSETALKREKDNQKVKHEVIHPEKRWKLERDPDIPVPEEEIEN